MTSSWRVSSWPLRRMVLGGLVLEEATHRTTQQSRHQKQKNNGSPNQTRRAIRPSRCSQNGQDFAKTTSSLPTNQQNNLLREADLLAYGVNALKPGQSAKVTLIRNRKKIILQLPRQK